MKPFKILGGILGLVAPQAAAAVGIVESIARTVSGDQSSDPEALEKAIIENPELLAEVKQAAMAREIEIERERTKQVEAVNETMQAELQHGTSFQKGWRPLNGYLFGITLFVNYAIVPLANIWTVKLVIPANIPELVFSFWAGVVGVAVHSRGKEKLAKLGNPDPSILEAVIGAFKK